MELTGYLAICSNLKLLRGSLNGKIGVTKKAVQKGRKIATLKRGTIHNLTGTFAFLSDGEGDLFLSILYIISSKYISSKN